MREMKIEKARGKKRKENLLVYLHNVRLKTEIIQLFSAHFLVLVLADKIFDSHLSTQHSNNQRTVKLSAPTETEFQWHEVFFSPFPYDVLSSLAPDLM